MIERSRATISTYHFEDILSKNDVPKKENYVFQRDSQVLSCLDNHKDQGI